MALFRMPRFLRRYFKRRMTPMTVEEAEMSKKKLSILYAFICWNAFGYVLYQVFNKKNVSWPVQAGLQTAEAANERPAFYYARLLDIPKATVYRIKGFNVSEPVDFTVNPTTKAVEVVPPADKQIFGENFMEEVMGFEMNESESDEIRSS